MEYTEMELHVIESFREFMNYDTLEANLGDNCTCLEVRELSEMLGYSIKTIKGIIGSLTKKDLIFVDIVNINHKVLMVTNEGIKEYFRLFGNNTNKEENNMIKVTEKATGTEFQAKKIDGGYEVYNLDGTKYKKIKDSTFKRNFKIEEDSTEEPTEEKTEQKPQKKSEVHVELSAEKREKMLDKIRKMLALAQDNPSMEEGLAAALHAQKLMAKYNIHQEEVELEEVKDQISSIFTHQNHKLALMGWRKHLGAIVAKNFRCKCYIAGQDVVFRGYTQDANIALDVYMALYTIGNKLAKAEETKARKTTGSAKGVYNSFALGYLRGIEEGFGEQCTALMIIVPKEVEEEYAEFSKNFGKSKGMQTHNLDADIYNKGKVEGKSAVKARAVEKKGE